MDAWTPAPPPPSSSRQLDAKGSGRAASATDPAMNGVHAVADCAVALPVRRSARCAARGAAAAPRASAAKGSRERAAFPFRIGIPVPQPRTSTPAVRTPERPRSGRRPGARRSRPREDDGQAAGTARRLTRWPPHRIVPATPFQRSPSGPEDRSAAMQPTREKRRRRAVARPLLPVPLFALAFGCGGGAQPPAEGGGAATAEWSAEYEALSLLGEELHAPELAEERRIELERQLEEARAAYERDPNDADAIIWLGRRTAYLGRYREAIAIFTEGIAKHPGAARMYRHRGHRLITVRAFAAAIAALERAAALVRGKPDGLAPDGMPNAYGRPTSTLQSNIWYHLGLAYYLAGEGERALEAFRACMEVAANPDMHVAAADWLYVTLRGLGRDAEAAAVLEPITADMQ